jgi:hypothetical protein
LPPEAFHPPANALVECPALPTLPEGATMGDLLRAAIDNVAAYNECAARHHAVIEWAKPDGNLMRPSLR